ncbi:Sip1-related alpha-galactosidase [uncultured Bifidobacterium sp.]|uniref:Sip1-related alpha-galactosidase n=1 Tax=uncultured Bifidobacterium sp. TaxID=165187 RepID=UPI00258309F5|nr:Sip1-related alpha-galactosidase [uncultured Bifidobacterium sp.]
MPRSKVLALLYAHGDDPYALVEQCVSATWWRLPVQPAGLRPFPAALRGFGWCTWDSLGQDVSEEGILAKMGEFKAKRVPVSWVLIDDGWSQTRDNKLTGFEADPTRFPQGLAHTIDVLKRDYGVRYVGVWQAFHGYWGGVDLESDAFKVRADTCSRRCRVAWRCHPRSRHGTWVWMANAGPGPAANGSGGSGAKRSPTPALTL